MAHEGLWEKLVALDPEVTARCTQCKYMSASDRYDVALLGRAYMVDPAKQRILSAAVGQQEQEANYLEQLCILAYLINAREVPLANKLVGAEALEGGQFFFRGLHSLPTKKLEKAFSQRPEQLYQVAREFHAKQCQFGDASIELYVLPRIPLTMIIWGQCDEFPARASILFDQTAAAHLPLDALLAAVNLAVEAVVRSVGKGS